MDLVCHSFGMMKEVFNFFNEFLRLKNRGIERYSHGFSDFFNYRPNQLKWFSVCFFENLLVNKMTSKFLFHLFFCFLLVACDRVKDNPKPNAVDGLELKDVKVTDVVINGSSVLDLVGENQFPSSVKISISHQPQFGSIVLNPQAQFVYTPNPGFFGTDSASYQVCDGTSCITGWIFVTVVDTTNPCTPQVSNESFSIPSGNSILIPLPESFQCGASISSIISDSPQNFSLIGGKVFASFPENQVSNGTFLYVVCKENRCDTGTVAIKAGLDVCQQKFKINPDTITMHPFELRKSFNFTTILANDISCLNDLILDSLQITAQGLFGTVEIQPKNQQGRWFKYTRNSTSNSASDSFSYTIKSKTGITGTAKVFIQIQ
jgi:Bacterial Ig domain